MKNESDMHNSKQVHSGTNCANILPISWQKYFHARFPMHVVHMLQIKTTEIFCHMSQKHYVQQIYMWYLHTASTFIVVVVVFVSQVVGRWWHDVVCQLKFVLGTSQYDLFHGAATYQTNHLDVPTQPRSNVHTRLMNLKWCSVARLTSQKVLGL